MSDWRSRMHPTTGEEGAALVRFWRFTFLARNRIGMKFRAAASGRCVIGEAYRHGKKYTVFFHPFRDICVMDGSLNIYEGPRGMERAIESIRKAPPPPPKHPIGYQRVRPNGFHKNFRGVKK